MINNLELIKSLLNFTDEGDFYMLYVFKRKKDQPEGEKDNHQSVRTIKTYCIESIDHLERRYDEIKQLCEMFKARAYIHVQKQNHFDVSLNMMVELAQRIQNGQHNQKGLFDSVVGQVKTQEKRWIVDVDMKDEDALMKIMKLINNGCKPLDVVNETHLHKSDGSVVVTYDYDPKVIKVIPTKSGYHLITKRFDVMTFNKIMSLQGDVPDIQKKNPTLLYLPNSLHQDQEMEHLKDANFIGGLTMPSEPNEWWSKIDK
jgi:hypothetical protein